MDIKNITERVDEIQREIDDRGAELWKEIFILRQMVHKLEGKKDA